MFKLIEGNYSSQAFSHPPFVLSLKCICHPDNSRQDTPSIVSVMIQVGGTRLLAWSHDREKFPVTTGCLKHCVWQPCLIRPFLLQPLPHSAGAQRAATPSARSPLTGSQLVGSGLCALTPSVPPPVWQHRNPEGGKGVTRRLAGVLLMPNLAPAARPNCPLLRWSEACESVLFTTYPRGVKTPQALQSSAWSVIPWA